MNRNQTLLEIIYNIAIAIIGGIFMNFENYNSTQNVSLSRKNHYVIFRAVRVPARRNPFSKICETNGQLEIRKICREVGKPTRLYSSSKKDGNPQRSATLMTRSSQTFGGVGFGIVKKNVNDISFFGENMNRIYTSYSKLRKNNDTPSLSNQQLKDRLNEYIISTNMDPSTVVNEVIMDIKSKDASFIYFSKQNCRISDHNGIEPNIIFRALDAIYLQREFYKYTKKQLPIYMYNSKTNSLDTYKVSDSDFKKMFEKAMLENNNYNSWFENLFEDIKPSLITQLLIRTKGNHYGLSNQDKVLETEKKNLKSASKTKQFFRVDKNNRNLLAYLDAFETEIKKDSELLKLSNSILSESFNDFNRFWKGEDTYSFFTNDKVTNLYNKNNYILNSHINLSSCLKKYKHDEESMIVAEIGLKKCLKYFSNSKNSIYKIGETCSHKDINIRQFTQMINSFSMFLPSDTISKYSPQINEITQNLKTEGKKLSPNISKMDI